MSPETSRKLQAFAILAILSVSEGRRVSSAILLRGSQSEGSAFNADGGAGEGAYIGAEHSHLTKMATLADQNAQELARFLTQLTDPTKIAGNPKLQEELWTLTGEVGSMMADPLLQEQATIVAEQLEKVTMADPLSKEVVTQMQVMMTDPYLQGEAEMLAKIMETETVARQAEAMQSFITNPVLHEHATRLAKQVGVMTANQNFQGQATRIAQLIETLIADANFQSHARQIVAHMEAMRAQGPAPDLFSLAEVHRAKSGVSFFPRSLATGMRSKVHGARAPASQMAAGRTRKIQDDEDEIGVLPPLFRYDPLQIREEGPERYRRFVEMEIKHGRLAMAAFLGVIVTYSGIRFPGYLSLSDGIPQSGAPPIKFEDVPGGTLSSLAAVPQLGWFQIIALISILEVSLFKQDPLKEAGDVVPDNFPWVRYDDQDVRAFKLNAERQNGRAAMMGIIGMIIHEALTGNPVFPIGE